MPAQPYLALVPICCNMPDDEDRHDFVAGARRRRANSEQGEKYLNLLKRGEIFGGHSASDATGTMSNPFSEHIASSPAVLGLIRNSPGNAYITEWKDG